MSFRRGGETSCQPSELLSACATQGRFLGKDRGKCRKADWLTDNPIFNLDIFNEFCSAEFSILSHGEMALVAEARVSGFFSKSSPWNSPLWVPLPQPAKSPQLSLIQELSDSLGTSPVHGKTPGFKCKKTVGAHFTDSGQRLLKKQTGQWLDSHTDWILSSARWGLFGPLPHQKNRLLFPEAVFQLIR